MTTMFLKIHLVCLPNTKADTITKAIKDTLTHCDICVGDKRMMEQQICKESEQLLPQK